MIIGELRGIVSAEIGVLGNVSTNARRRIDRASSRLPDPSQRLPANLSVAFGCVVDRDDLQANPIGKTTLAVLVDRPPETFTPEEAAKGRALSNAELLIPRRVDVRFPGRIRLLLVSQMPFSENPQLAEAASQLELLGPKTSGLTLGYSILAGEGCLSDRLLSHECRHVYQCEQAGGIARFLRAYLQSVAGFGYYDSPFERDARIHEVGEG